MMKRKHLSWIVVTVLMGVASSQNDGDRTQSSRSRWWRTENQSLVQANLRHYQWQVHQQQMDKKKSPPSDEDNRKFWLTRNGQQVDDDAVVDVLDDPKKMEALALLENLVHPEEELLDEINDRQIIQAVISSMAQWNLRKIQKMQRRLDHGTSKHRSRRDEAMVCYNELGCFRDEGPFSYLDLLPAPPEEINTRFYLYTPRNKDAPYQLVYNNASTILASPYNASLPTKVMIHGFGSSCQRIWAKEMRTALISVGDVNVICVDWENGANLPNYVRAAVNARLVGRQVSLLINAINGLVGSKNADFHLIGFSLGAHVAGFAGSELRNVSRITGLDPAGPLFENYDPRARLDSTDADLVDVIHSNGEKIYMGGLGAWAPMGDIDFYPNGGRMQKGCTNLFVGAVSDMIWSSAEENGRSLCNHRRAYKLFTDSVVPGCHFPAFACESYEKLLEGDCFPCVDPERCSNMGYYADKSPGRGIMYLATREEEPFCANQYRVHLQSTVTLQPVTTQGKIELVLIGANNFNETFTLTKGPDYELISGGKLVRLIVPHPSFSPPSRIHIVYTAYHGWIYSGLAKWPIDKIVLTDSYGKSVSYCQKGLILESGKGLAVTLQPGECNPATVMTIPQVLINSLANNNNQLPFSGRTQPEVPPLDNEIPVFNDVRFRSLDSDIISINQSVEVKPVRSNATNNIYPYGNVPFNLLQQQIPADIKVGGGNGPTSSKRPSFHQWPLVGNFFGNHGRSRFKSGSGTGRKYEPQGQLTPPSLEQLQQVGGMGAKDVPPSNSRRPFTRRKVNQPTMSAEDQHKVEYYLLRQQQLHWQQQQLHQANRLLLGDANKSQQLTRGQALSFQQYQQQLLQQQQQGLGPLSLNQWVPQRQVAPPPPPPPQWRPDALAEPEVSRYPVTNKPIVQLSMPLEHLQQTFAQTLLNPSNQQFIERVRNQQQQTVPPQIRSSMLATTTDSTPPSTSSLVVTSLMSSSSSTLVSPVTLTTMTISNTLAVQTDRLPEIEQAFNATQSGLDPSTSTESTLGTKAPVHDDAALLATVEAATLLTAMTPSSNRQMNETSSVNSTNDGSRSGSSHSTTPDLEESSSTNQPWQSTNNVSHVAAKEDVGLPQRENSNNAAVLWSDDPFSSDSGSSTALLMADEVYPNPEQLGLARDEYWSSKATTVRNRQTTSSLAIVGPAYYPNAAVRPSRMQSHQLRYIPINAVDRQSRHLQAQYYADSIVKPTLPVLNSTR